jgi:hypothetical protein
MAAVQVATATSTWREQVYFSRPCEARFALHVHAYRQIGEASGVLASTLGTGAADTTVMQTRTKAAILSVNCIVLG